MAAPVLSREIEGWNTENIAQFPGVPQGVADNAADRSENRPINSVRLGKYRPASRINEQALRDIANSWLAPRPRYQGTRA